VVPRPRNRGLPGTSHKNKRLADIGPSIACLLCGVAVSGASDERVRPGLTSAEAALFCRLVGLPGTARQAPVIGYRPPAWICLSLRAHPSAGRSSGSSRIRRDPPRRAPEPRCRSQDQRPDKGAGLTRAESRFTPSGPRGTQVSTKPPPRRTRSATCSPYSPSVVLLRRSEKRKSRSSA
jgi:hypothetical protein